MTDAELFQARTQKWRLDGQSVRTIEDARAFFESVGFCVMYPMRPAILVPTFIGAWVGADDKLPMRQHAYNDPRAKEATELMVRALRDRAAYEAPLIDENNAFLLAPSVFPYFYSLVGERNPKLPPASGPRSPYSPLACDAFEIIRQRGPISKAKLGEMLGGAVTNAGLDRALSELWAKLRITRVDYTVAEGSVWDELSRWAPDMVREGVGISVPEALSALVSKYLDCVIAVDEGEVENFLANFVPRTRVKEAIHALLSARELSFVHVGSKSLVQVTPPKQVFIPKNRRPERVS
jgi:23S rRNA pseudouridine2605 synthase